MDFVTSNSSLMMEKSLDYLWTKQTAILDNISNAETPGYKSKYVTFEETLQNKLSRVSDAPGYVSKIRDIVEETEPVVGENETSTRMDENGVNTTEQSLALVKNAYQLQSVMKAVNSDFSILKTAING